MKSTLSLLLALVSLVSSAETLLRIRGGVEETTQFSAAGLPDIVAAPLRERMLSDGWAPYVPAEKPSDTWCTTSVRCLTLTNGVWRETWQEASVPVPLDRARLVGTLLALPDGTNLLATALASEPVAAWFAGEPTYVRGSQGAATVSAALGVDAATLEALVAASLGIELEAASGSKPDTEP
ncbi:MAG: hypothetical protein IJV65_08540 [Kiritimatiellae bacterium]|nr:hypothetical protein [Kiritimatiellia bacterium]